MLSFYEMNCLLEEQKRGQDTVNEALSPEMRQKILAMRQSKGVPAQVDMPTPTPTPEAPAVDPAASAAPAPAPAAPAKRALPPSVRANLGQDVNDPSSDAYKAQFNSKFQDAGKMGYKPGSSKTLNTNATGRMEDNISDRETELVEKFNKFLADPSYQGFVAMAISDLKMPYKVPEGRFEIGRQDRNNGTEQLVVPSKSDLMAILSKAMSYPKVQMDGEMVSGGKPFKMVISEKWNADPRMRYTVLRAMQMENFIQAPEVVNTQTTMGNLAALLGKRAGRKPFLGGLESPEPIEDVTVLGWLIKVAQSSDFGHFFEVNGDLSNPQTPVRIRSTAEASKTAAPGSGSKIGSTSDRIRAKFGQQPKTEASEWMDVMDLMEHWGF